MASKPIDPKVVPQPQPGFHEEEIDSELVLYHPEAAQVVYLNPSATIVWCLCDGHRSLADIIAVLEGEYPNEQTIEPDVHSAIYRFTNVGAISLS